MQNRYKRFLFPRRTKGGRVMESERNCNACIWSTRDGGCSSWDCEFVDKMEAYKAWKEKQENEQA